ncbi:MAG: type II toxin-antitoxin system PemK/MazF family toxin [Tepidanaerobacteraceae bacterium]|nr:type II toxin-antitoxin system PemK/MazF family toxin [Tepidanaerobacteraceae bacterium]
MVETQKVKRGEIYYVDLGEGVGSEVKKIRPCIIIQNDIGNKFSPTTIICPITHRRKNTKQPTQVILNRSLVNGNVDGVILAEQLRIIDKTRIIDSAGSLTDAGLIKLEQALRISIGVQ